MPEATTLAATIDAFDRARGAEEDGLWAFAVSVSLLRREVDADLVREGLAQALEVVRATQEPPEELYGTSREHADALYDQWFADGDLRLDPTTVAWRDVPASGLAWSSACAVVFAVLLLVRGEWTTDWTLGKALLPVGLGVGTAFMVAAWGSLSARRATLSAGAGTAALVIGGAALLGTTVLSIAGRPVATVGSWWFLVEAAVLALLSSVVRRGTDRLAPATPVAGNDDWSRRLAGILRAHHWLPSSRVRMVIAEAEAHAAQSGRSVREEFGTPEEYAARLAPDVRRRTRWVATFWAVLAAVWVVSLVIDGLAWTTLGSAVICAGLAWSAFRNRGAAHPGP